MLEGKNFQTHKILPINQHQTTEAGPPVKSGVLKVVAMEEHIPMMENANEKVDKLFEKKKDQISSSCSSANNIFAEDMILILRYVCTHLPNSLNISDLYPSLAKAASSLSYWESFPLCIDTPSSASLRSCE